MGRRPDQEDSVSQTHGDSKNTSGYSNPPVDPFGTQDADPFGSGSRRHSTYGNQKQNEVPAPNDQTSTKSTETKRRSKWGEAPTDIDSGKQATIKDNEPIFETDPFG